MPGQTPICFGSVGACIETVLTPCMALILTSDLVHHNVTAGSNKEEQLMGLKCLKESMRFARA